MLKKLSRALDEFGPYIDNNVGAIVNYGEWRRCGEHISTGFVESTINQLVAKRFVKKQQMRWTPRDAHLLLQVLVQVLNNEPGAAFSDGILNSALARRHGSPGSPQEMDTLRVERRRLSRLSLPGLTSPVEVSDRGFLVIARCGDKLVEDPAPYIGGRSAVSAPNGIGQLRARAARVILVFMVPAKCRRHHGRTASR